MRLPLRSFATLVLAVGVATCSDTPNAVVKTAPEGRGGVGRFSIAPKFSPQAAAVYAQRATFAVANFDRVRIVLTRPPNDVVIDTVITFNTSSPQTTLDLFVDVKTSNEIFDGAIQYTNNGAVVYEALGKVQSYPPGGSPPPAQELVAVYVGPGANATRVAITPKTSTIQAPGSTSFTATAFDANNTAVPSAPIAWTVSDATIGTLSASSGASTSLSTAGKRGTVTVTASIPTNASDNASVTVTLPPAAIVLVSGGGQTGKAGNALAAPATVRVNAADGIGVQGVSVQFAAPAGGSVGSTSVTTDAQGQATSTLTLGGVVGAQSFAATAAGFSVSIPATATPGDPAAIAAVSGGGQQDSVNRALRAPFVVRVTDRFGNGVGNVTVNWTKTSGGGSLGGTTSVTGADGTASISYTLGSTAGTEGVSASVAGVATPATFSATAVTGPASIAAVNGTGQTGRVGQPLPTPFVVRVVDVSGAPVAGAIVTWTATNGTISGGGVTDSQGQASASFTLGTAVGAATATATVGSGPSAKSVTFTATVQPGTVSRIVFRTAPSSVGVGAVMVPPVQIELQDAGGNRTNAVNPVSIALGANPGQATLGGTLTRNAVAGVATFDDLTLSAVGSGYTLVATSAGTQNITSAAFDVTSSSSTTIAFVDGQTFAPIQAPSVTMTAGSPPTNPPAIRVLDGQGAPIPNVTVSYSVIRNGMTLFGGTPQTNAQGIITFATLAISPNNLQVAGNYSFVASLTGATGSPLSLPVTVNPAAAAKYIVTASTTTPAPSANATISAQLADQYDNAIAQSQRTVNWAFTGGGFLASAASPTNGAGIAANTYTAAANPSGTVNITATDVATPSITGQITLTPQSAPPTPSQLGILTQPSASTMTGSVLAQQPSVQVQDANGNPIATPTPMTITATWSAGSVQNATATTNASGVATFTNLTLVGTGTAPIVFSATGLTSATSINVTSTIQLAAQEIRFQVHPSATTQGATITPPVQVRIVDGDGNTVTSATNTVSIAIGANPGNGTLSGTLSVAAVNGVATFSSLSIDNVGASYTLDAASLGLGTATSNTFDIVAGGATRTWTGAVSSTWNDAANWVNGVPGAADDVIIPSGTPNVPTLPTTSIRSLAINASAVANVGSGATFTTANGLTNQGTLNLVQSTIAGPLMSQGLLFVAGSSSLTGTVTTAASSIIRIQGQPTNGGANLTVTSAVTNLGIIELTDISAGYGATLTMPSATLTNATGGVILAQQGANGPRTIAASLNNQSAITVANTQGITLSRAGAAHTNSGTIALASGNLTVTQIGTFTNTGNIAIGSGRSLSMSGGAIDLAGGTTTGAGLLTVSNAALTFTPVAVQSPLALSSTTITGNNVTIGNGQQLNLVASTVASDITIQGGGTFLVTGAVTVNGVVTTTAPATGPGSTIRIQGQPSQGAANLTVANGANGFTNLGTIELTDISAGYGATLTVPTGTFTNQAGATFSALQGANGPRTLAARLNNQSTITIANSQGLTLALASAAHTNSGTIALSSGNLTLTQSGTSPSFTNAGTITLASGRTWTVNGGLLDVSTGLVSGAGVLDVNNATLALTTATMTTPLSITNTTISGNSVTIPTGQQLHLVSSTLSSPLTIQDNGVFLVNGAVTVNAQVTTSAPTIGSGSLIRIQGAPSYGLATLTVANGASGFTNLGTIELTDVSAGYGATLSVPTGTFTNQVGATVSVLQGANGPRTLAVELLNQATIALANTQGLTLNRASAAHVNAGTITVTSGNLTVAQSGTSPSFTNTGTITLASGRTWTVNGGLLNVSAGLVSGAGTLDVNGAELTFTTATMTTPLSINTSTITGNAIGIPSGQQLHLVSSTVPATVSVSGNATLLVNGAVTINGQVNTTAPGAAPGSLIRVQGAPSYGLATLTISNGANGFTNLGTVELTDINAGYGATLSVPTGTFTNAVGATLTPAQGANGPRTIAARLNNLATITIGGTQGLTLNMASAAHTNSGAIAVTSGNLTVTQSGTSPSFTNTGTITLASGRTWTVNGGLLDVSAGLVSGAGTLDVNGAELTFTTATMTTPLSINTSTITGNAIGIPSGQQLHLVSSTVPATVTVGGNATLLVNGAVTISGQVNTTAPGASPGSLIRIQGAPSYGLATLTISNGATGFTNLGTVELTDINAGYGATLSVPTGTFTNAVGATLTPAQGANGPRTVAARLNNLATITIGATQGMSLNLASATHVNAGTINVTNGDLTVSSATTSFTNASTGVVSIATARDLIVQGGLLDLSAGTLSATGTGRLVVSNATFNFTTATMTAPVSLTNTTIQGGAVVVPSGQSLNIVGGTLNANLTLGANALFLANGTVTVNGAVTTTAASVAPGSTIRVQGNGTYSTAALTFTNSFTNNGQIQLTDVTAGYGASLTISSGGTLTNASTGTIDAQTGAGAGGPRTLAANVVNQGVVTVSSGAGPHTFAITGNFTTTGTVNLDITNASGGADRINVSGVATLGGTLTVNATGAFVPNSTAVYTLFGYTSRTGNFATYNLPSNAVNGWQTPNVGATTLSIQAN